MIKLEFGEMVVAYFGFIVPLFILKTPPEAAMISFYIAIWCLNCWIWTNWKR